MINVPVEVKDALREGTYKKNYRFVVLNDDGTPDAQVGTIDNDYLVSESVSIDERMCSGDTLKFGLCEGSSLEFQYFNKPNITGKRVQAFVDVQYRAGIMGHIDAGGSFTTPVNGSYTFEVKKGSATGLYITYAGGGDIYVDFVLGQTTDTEELEVGDVVTLNNPSTDALFEVSTDMWDTIPMGFFDVKKCSRQASTGIMKVTAYNKLMSEYLDAKANEQLIESYDELINTSGIDTVTIDAILNKSLETFEITEAVYEKLYFITDEYKSAYQTGFMSYQIYDNNHQPTGEYVSFALPEVRLGIEDAIHIHTSVGGYWQADGYWRLYLDTTSYYVALNKYIDDVVEELNLENCYFYYYIGSTIYWVSFKERLLYGLITASSSHRSLVVMFKISNSFFTRVLIDGIIESPIIQDISAYYNTKDFIQFENIPCVFKRTTTPSLSNAEKTRAISESVELIKKADFKLYRQLDSSIGSNVVTRNELKQWSDVTFRNLQSAVFETQCQFGQLSRTTDLFSGVELNHSRLYPADSLYPATDLYPDGAVVSGFKSMYSKLWADEGNIHKWRYLNITYKGLNADQQEEDFTLQRTINADGTDDYNMSDNWLFRNLVWTAEDVGTYADAMVPKMQDITWFPFEMWCAGLPYLETGDEIEIPLGDESYTSYILQRQLKGIQNLQDTYINGTLDIF